MKRNHCAFTSSARALNNKGGGGLYSNHWKQSLKFSYSSFCTFYFLSRNSWKWPQTVQCIRVGFPQEITVRVRFHTKRPRHRHHNTDGRHLLSFWWALWRTECISILPVNVTLFTVTATELLGVNRILLFAQHCVLPVKRPTGSLSLYMSLKAKDIQSE